MNGFSILMFIFSALIFLVGFYMYSGHKLMLLSFKVAYRNLDKKGWINVGKWTMIAGIIPFLLGLFGLFFVN